MRKPERPATCAFNRETRRAQQLSVLTGATGLDRPRAPGQCVTSDIAGWPSSALATGLLSTVVKRGCAEGRQDKLRYHGGPWARRRRGDRRRRRVPSPLTA